MTPETDASSLNWNGADGMKMKRWCWVEGKQKADDDDDATVQSKDPSSEEELVFLFFFLSPSVQIDSDKTVKMKWRRWKRIKIGPDGSIPIQPREIAGERSNALMLLLPCLSFLPFPWRWRFPCGRKNCLHFLYFMVQLRVELRAAVFFPSHSSFLHCIFLAIASIKHSLLYEITCRWRWWWFNSLTITSSLPLSTMLFCMMSAYSQYSLAGLKRDEEGRSLMRPFKWYKGLRFFWSNVVSEV